MKKEVTGETLTVNVTLRHSSNNSTIEEYARAAVGKLAEMYPEMTSSHVILDHQKNDYEKNKIAEITVHVPQHDFVAKDAGLAYEACIDACVAALGRQLQKHKEKMH
ncbi:MAG: HPF/RaiA family ribosome-associated protein [Candidatus Chlorobium antarcticum]|jgi:putative sigma-54 modulation protein|nr:HPF/RaiA family ribosome-associated protein [Candidatus Chlorobium antarcticum]